MDNNALYGIANLVGSVVQATTGVLTWLGIKPPFSKKPLLEDMSQPQKKRGKIILFLMVGYFITTALGFWFLFRNPKPKPCPVPPLAKECPAVTPPKAAADITPKLTRKTPAQPTRQGGSQTGNGNAQGNVGGDVDMSGDGCQQKIIGGSNNTNNCSPTLPKISDSQASTMIAYLKKIPNLRGQVFIGYETAVEGGPELAQKLQEILKAANIDTTIEGAMMIAGCSNGAHPGLSIACEEPMNTDLADAIDKALIKSKITKNPLKREQNSLQNNPSLELIIKNP